MHLQVPAIFMSEDASYVDFHWPNSVRVHTDTILIHVRIFLNGLKICVLTEKWSGHIFFFVFIYNDFRNIFISGKYLLKCTRDALK